MEFEVVLGVRGAFSESLHCSTSTSTSSSGNLSTEIGPAGEAEGEGVSTTSHVNLNYSDESSRNQLTDPLQVLICKNRCRRCVPQAAGVPPDRVSENSIVRLLRINEIINSLESLLHNLSVIAATCEISTACCECVSGEPQYFNLLNRLPPPPLQLYN